MIGPYINAGALVVGSAIGAFLGPRLSKSIRLRLPLIFGCTSMAVALTLIMKVQNLSAVVLAICVGTIIGEIIHFEGGIEKTAGMTKGVVEKMFKPSGDLDADEYTNRFVALVVLFGMSGTGIYGALNEGMTGDPTLLIIKSILDFFTAMIFASSMGYSLMIMFVPQVVVQGILFYLARVILPLVTPAMLGDFSACGGVILLGIGLRLCGTKLMPVANMLPAFVLVMPISSLWMHLAG